MKGKIRRAIVRFLYYLPKKIAHKILYYMVFREKLNIKDPQNFNEKIQWLILHEYNEKFADLADKYKVRNYITKRNYENLLPKLYGVYESAYDIDIDKLPNKFVLKPNNGCGHVFVCTNKSEFNFNECFTSLNKALKENFAKSNLEYHYKFIEPKIICEEYLEDKNNILPQDYKFYCYNGHVECILVCSNREKELKLDYYDKKWNYLNYSKTEYRSNKKISKPKNLNEMIKIASDLSQGFKFVRVDLYNINGKIYFGELTFTPASGLVKYNTDEALQHLGKLIELK